jgi:hypothetical protein
MTQMTNTQFSDYNSETIILTDVMTQYTPPDSDKNHLQPMIEQHQEITQEKTQEAIDFQTMKEQHQEITQEKTQEAIDFQTMKETILQIVKIHTEQINRLKDDIMQESNINIAESKAKIIVDTIDHFKLKLKTLRGLEKLFDSDFDTIKSSDSDIDADSDSSSDEPYYSNTESEYNFDDTDDNLKIGKDNKMVELADELKRRENIDMLKISKKR